MAFQDHVSLWTTLTTIIATGLLSFLAKLYKARINIARLRKQGLPMPPWNPILGHLHFLYKIVSTLPKDVNPLYQPDMIRRRLPDLGPIYYLDTWPFGPQILVVTSTHGLYQISQEHSLPKYPALKEFIRPIAGGLDLVTMEGPVWKRWRGIFNPGFSANYLMTLTSSIVEETDRFCEILRGFSQDRRLFHMKDLTDNLTMDIIGRIVMNVKLGSQTYSNPLVVSLRMQVKWLTFGSDINPFTRYNPLRPLVHWYNTRRMDRYITPKVEKRFMDLKYDSRSDKSNKSILDLVLTTYLSENERKEVHDMDPTFKSFTISQVKLFLFAGHDTTSSTVCYIFYILATNPTALALVRAEHDSVVGLDTSKTASTISSDPFLLNKLPYTLAVIKEVMRLYPAVSSTRVGEPNFSVTDDQGRHFPTDGFLVWDNPQAIHRDPAYWPRPDEFVPERWLVEPGDPLHPGVKGAWRPFSQGPRNCIGQELAVMEMKVIMVMTARTFDIALAYEEYDRKNRMGGISHVYGERGYPIQRAQPSGDLPCRAIQRVQ